MGGILGEENHRFNSVSIIRQLFQGDRARQGLNL
jgi:hypothetical protein